MCQTAVYLLHKGKEELVLQDVVHITPQGATLKLVNLFGEEKVVEGRIRQIDLLSHRITIRATGEEENAA